MYEIITIAFRKKVLKTFQKMIFDYGLSL